MVQNFDFKEFPHLGSKNIWRRGVKFILWGDLISDDFALVVSTPKLTFSYTHIHIDL